MGRMAWGAVGLPTDQWAGCHWLLRRMEWFVGSLAPMHVPSPSRPCAGSWGGHFPAVMLPQPLARSEEKGIARSTWC